MTAPSQNARLRPFRPVPFGRYTLLSPLSMGGMGEIFLARLEGAQGFEKLCVIKKILPQLAQDAEFVERFVNEAKILVKLMHGSIAQVLDVGLHEGDPYIALEHIDGKDLRKVAARARDRNVPLPLTLTLYTMSRVLDALAYAHRKRDDDEKEIGLVHRDVSPQNILISYEGEVKVIDFGLAKSSLSSAKTNPSMILGKFLYMSPEQARHQKVDRRSDLYSAGLCLYELICGKNPFDDVAPHELMMKVANPAIPPIATVDPLVPPAVQEIVARALELDPAKRFQTAEEFRGKLMACLLEIDPSAGPESVTRYMRDAFAAEYQQERKLLASLKSIARPTEEPEPQAQEKKKETETAVFHLKDVAPTDGRARTLTESPAAAPTAPRVTPDGKIAPAPLSFAPTPRTREDDGRAKPQDDATMPGVIVTEELRQAMVEEPTGNLKALETPWDERSTAASLPARPSASSTPPGMPTEAPTLEVDGGTQREVVLSPETLAALTGKGPVHEDTQPRVVIGTLLDDAAPVLPGPKGRVRTTAASSIASELADPQVYDRVPPNPVKRAGPAFVAPMAPPPTLVSTQRSDTNEIVAAVDGASSSKAIHDEDTGVRPMPEPPPTRRKKSNALAWGVTALIGATLATVGWFAYDLFLRPKPVTDVAAEDAALPSMTRPIVPPPGARDPRTGAAAPKSNEPNGAVALPPTGEPSNAIAGGEPDGSTPGEAVAAGSDAGPEQGVGQAGAGAADGGAVAANGDTANADAGGADDLIAELTAPAKVDPPPPSSKKEPAAAAVVVPAKASTKRVVNPAVRELKADWSDAQKTFKVLERKHTCDARQMKLICAQYDMLAPEMGELSGDDPELDLHRSMLKKLREDMAKLSKKGR